MKSSHRKARNYVQRACNHNKQSTVQLRYVVDISWKRFRIKFHNLNWIISQCITMWQKNTMQGKHYKKLQCPKSFRGLRNNRGSRYQEVFFFFFSLSENVKPEADLWPMSVTTYFLSGHAQHRTVIAGIAHSAATYMHLQFFFPFTIGHGRGSWKSPGAWRDSTIRIGNENAWLCIVRTTFVARGANFIPRATSPVIADITFLTHIFRYKR